MAKKILNGQNGETIGNHQEEDLLDWDASIETIPPPYRAGTIKVRLKYIGRSRPIPLKDPFA